MDNSVALSKFFKILGIIVLVVGIGLLIAGIIIQITTFVNYLAEYNEWARTWSESTEALRPSMPMFSAYIPIGFIVIFFSSCLFISSKMADGNILFGGKQD